MIATSHPRAARAGMSIAIFGSGLGPARWNGAKAYFRGIIRALHQRGHRVRFYEPDTFERRRHGDLADPDWVEIVAYPAESERGVLDAVESTCDADVVVKASGVGVHDGLLESAVLALRSPGRPTVFWDVDAPATLARLEAAPSDPLRKLLPRYDLVLTCGGGEPVVRRYLGLGARACVPVYHAVDPEVHHPVAPDPRLAGDLALVASRLPAREARVDEFFLRPAAALPERTFFLGGVGWDEKPLPPNVRYLGHVPERDRNTLNCSPMAVLSVSRGPATASGCLPPPRVFEAAGAGACLITDAWEGIELFLEPRIEVLVAASGEDVVRHLRELDLAAAAAIGDRARRRVLREHTYAHRAEQVEAVLEGRWTTRLPAIQSPAPERAESPNVGAL